MVIPGWVGVDLDGTLVEYHSGDYCHSKIGKPIMPMVKRVQQWLARGYTVKIVTARAAGDRTGLEVQLFTKAINEFCVEHFGEVLEVTCQKDYGMIVLFDDRAISVEKNTGRITSELTDDQKDALMLA